MPYYQNLGEMPRKGITSGFHRNGATPTFKNEASLTSTSLRRKWF